MTEQEWLACTNPNVMLEHVQFGITYRKLRLFSVVCCRHAWQWFETGRIEKPRSHSGLLAHERRILHEAVLKLDVVERYVDDPSTANLGRVYCDVLGSLRMRRPTDEPWAFLLVAILRAATPGGYYYGDAWEIGDADPVQLSRDAASYCGKALGWAGSSGDNAMKAQAGVLRDVLGDPFSQLKANDTWLSPPVTTLAQAIYDDRAFENLPKLADALEQAGCTDADILGHCRGPRPHVRGCWVVDLILGKE